MRNSVRILSIIVLILIISSPDLLAQCPMCRATAESNLQNGGTEGRGLNNGILYLLCTPYVIIGTIYFFWRRNRKNIDG
ncbi:MAG: hypothetical protein AAGF87_04925 [Bacteroidota bacterium]